MNFTINDTIFSVSSLTRELKTLVESKYRFIRVQGEISSLKRPYSGHSYFTLKDENAQLRAVLFKGSARFLAQELQDGQQVVCHGRLSVYEPRGDYQLIIDSVDFQGSGQLQIRFEALKQKLAEEGLFAAEKKKPLPTFPDTIVILTSPSGAAVHDFLKVWRSQGFPTDISIFPVPVQGAGAAEEISKGIRTINRELPESDMIVLCRGGGSIEDLWAFNEEVLARAIVRSAIPIVSAVGHEVDFTISDFCADYRAATPTAAAKAIIPDSLQYKNEVRLAAQSLKRTVTRQLEQYQNRVNQNRRLLGDLDFLFTNVSLRLAHATDSLFKAILSKLTTHQTYCRELTASLQRHSPVSQLHLQQQRLLFATEKLQLHILKILENKQQQFGQLTALLDAVSPLATLSRGYSISSKINMLTGKKHVVHTSDELTPGDQLEVRLYKGKVECAVNRVLLDSDE